MDSIRKWWVSHRPTSRRLIQLYTALLYNAHLKGFIRGEIFRGGFKAVCSPGLNCYSCPGAVTACPLGAIQNALASAGHRAGWYVLGIVLLFGVTLGRTICGWLCPMGLIQELLHRIPTPKLRKGKVTRGLSHLKYAVLVVFVAAIPLWYGFSAGMPVPGFCKYICPAGTLEGAVGLLTGPQGDALFPMLGGLFTLKFAIMVLIGLACVFCWRAFCRFLCPLGAIYGLFNRVALVGVKADAGRCTGCGSCVRRCPMDVRRVGDRECISCGKCMDVCGEGAISLRCGNLTLKESPVEARAQTPAAAARRRCFGRAAWIAALAVLIAALVAFNLPGRPANDASPAQEDSTVPVGSAPGERLPDFTAELLDGGAFHLADHRGQVVFINLWATYCGPCVRELSDFERLQAEHPDVVVLAVHSALVTEDVADYVARQGWKLDFALDAEDEALFRLVNGSATLPQTVVLDPRGEVVYNQVGSVDYEMLLGLLEKAREG